DDFLEIEDCAGLGAEAGGRGADDSDSVRLDLAEAPGFEAATPTGLEVLFDFGPVLLESDFMFAVCAGVSSLVGNTRLATLPKSRQSVQVQKLPHLAQRLHGFSRRN